MFLHTVLTVKFFPFILNNVDKRQPLTNDVLLSTLLNPATKSLVSLSGEEIQELVSKAENQPIEVLQ